MFLFTKQASKDAGLLNDELGTIFGSESLTKACSSNQSSSDFDVKMTAFCASVISRKWEKCLCDVPFLSIRFFSQKHVFVVDIGGLFCVIQKRC